MHNSQVSLLDEAKAAHRAGSHNRALELYRATLQADSRNPAIHNAIGEIHESRNALTAAITAYSRAYLYAPYDPVITKNLATAFMRVGQYQAVACMAAKPDSTLDYPLAAEAMLRHLEGPEIQHTPTYQSKLRPYDNLIEALSLPRNPQDRLLALFNCIRFSKNNWRNRALARLQNEEFWQWVKISGLEQIEGYLAAGKGVILLGTHTEVGRVATMAFARLGLKFNSLEEANYLARDNIPGISNVNFIEVGGKAFTLREVYLARQALQRGEILQIAPDGHHGGKGNMVYQFLGRLRPFSTGFADLAILTGAPAFPLICTNSLDGIIHIKILPPLDAPDSSQPREAKQKLLIQQYVTFLEHMWRTHPSGVFRNHIKMYLSRPAA